MNTKYICTQGILEGPQISGFHPSKVVQFGKFLMHLCAGHWHVCRHVNVAFAEQCALICNSKWHSHLIVSFCLHESAFSLLLIYCNDKNKRSLFFTGMWGVAYHLSK